MWSFVLCLSCSSDPLRGSPPLLTQCHPQLRCLTYSLSIRRDPYICSTVLQHLELLCKLHIIIKFKLKACRKQLDNKLNPEKRRKRYRFNIIGKLSYFKLLLNVSQNWGYIVHLYNIQTKEYQFCIYYLKTGKFILQLSNVKDMIIL